MGALFKVYKSDGITEIANIKSVVFREAVNTGEYLIPGCVSSAEIEVEVFNTQANAVSAGDVVYAYVYDNANNGTLLGKFNCEPRIDTKNSYKFTAYDNALKLEADFSQWLQANQSNFPYTIKQLVQQACTIAGVTLGSSSWPLSTQSVQAFYADGLTCRDVLSYAAELAGRFVRCHTDGNIYFDWYAANANSIAPSAGTGVYAYKQDGLTYANYTTTALARVAVHPSGEDDVAYIYPTGVTSGNTLHIKNNLLLTGADASFYNAAAQQVYTAVTAVGSYCPMSVNLFPRENPFRAGDIVSITDAQSVMISAPITGMTISNAAATLVSDGRENYEDTTETAKAITQLASDVVRINKLKVDWADINTAIINYLTANDVVAQNLTIVDANDVVLATFNANGITIGQTNKNHMEIDFNSLELFDKNGNKYVSIGDIRDANGRAELQEEFVGNGSQTLFEVGFSIYSITSVSVNGNALPSTAYSKSGSKGVLLTTAPSDGDSVVIVYKTTSPVYHFDFGSRVGAIGANSMVSGDNNTSSGTNASVTGGYGNSSTGTDSHIGGGYNNTANRKYSTVSGGDRNTASGDYSTAVGGSQNTASGAFSVAGGYQNTASGNKSASVGGDNNSATGAYSCILGGNGNEATGSGSAIIGGSNNDATGVRSAVCGGGQCTASGVESFVGGGTLNTSSGNYSAVVGGRRVSASGVYSAAMGGLDCTASGDNSSVVGGMGITANHRSQVVFGEYNELDPSTQASIFRGNYIEIVGKGSSNNSRSNARTLDWSGNETLAGGLTLGVPLAITDGGTGATTAAAARTNLGCAVGHITASLASLPTTINKTWLTANHRVINCVLGTPSAITSDLTWTTSAGSIVLSGTMSGTTTIDLDLVITNT